jgi:hypothetical protein
MTFLGIGVEIGNGASLITLLTLGTVPYIRRITSRIERLPHNSDTRRMPAKDVVIEPLVYANCQATSASPSLAIFLAVENHIRRPLQANRRFTGNTTAGSQHGSAALSFARTIGPLQSD